jgi:hypothetical protein
MRIILNVLGLCVELALIAGLAALAYHAPFVLAGGTAGLILIAGSVLEWLRLRHEFPFFFGEGRGFRFVFVTLTAAIEVTIKAVAAGVALLLTFAGSEQERLVVLAVIFGLCLFAGSSVLRRGYYYHGVRPARWGYFRLAVPLGVLFSLCVQFAVALKLVTVPSLQALAGSLVFDLPARPNLAQISDLAFNVRQTLDALIVDVGGRLLGEAYAPVLAVLLSINVLIGFGLAILVVAIIEIVLRIEGAGLGSDDGERQAG